VDRASHGLTIVALSAVVYMPEHLLGYLNDMYSTYYKAQFANLLVIACQLGPIALPFV